MKYKNIFHSGLLILGISISAILVLLFPNFYHYDDVRAFLAWSQVWNQGWQDIYKNCASCNYPILGMVSSAGLLSLLARIDSQNAIRAFRIILAIIDGVNVLLIFLLMKEFSIKNAALWAGIVGLLPSSWAGAALWGQIDGVSQFFLLATLLWVVKCNLSAKRNVIIFLFISSLLLSFLLLTKQLIVFSFFSLEFLLIVNIFFFRKNVSAIAFTALQLVFLAVFIFLWDPFLHLEGSNISHLQLIWGARSSHSNILSANGINIWVFLHRDMGSSSHAPFWFLANYPFIKKLTPYHISVFLFLAFVAVLSLSTLLSLRRHFNTGNAFLNKEVLLNFVLYLAIVNLGFNVLLTGTHERYLFHFYPFLILACLGLREYSKLFSKPLLAAIVIGSTLYGLFVLGVLLGFPEKYVFYSGYQAHKILAVYHAALLSVLFIIVLKYQGIVNNLKGLLKGMKIQ